MLVIVPILAGILPSRSTIDAFGTQRSDESLGLCRRRWEKPDDMSHFTIDVVNHLRL